VVTAGVRDGDDREPRLDRLAVSEENAGGRVVHDPARRRRRAQQCRVCPRRSRQDERDRRHKGDRASSPPETHASDLFPESRPTAPSTRAAPATINATIARVELPPPPIELLASSRGAGVSDDSGPDQSTTSPSE